MLLIKLVPVLFIFLCVVASGLAQPSPGPHYNDNQTLKYPSFVKKEKNELKFASNLDSFFYKLYQVEKGERKRVNIVHIGDSHLQAGSQSKILRTQFHADFGNAGRGLVFPYQVAKSNSPHDIKSSSPFSWEKQRNASYVHKIPIGISGHSIRTFSDDFRLTLALRENNEDIEGFDKVTVFRPFDKRELQVTMKGLGGNVAQLEYPIAVNNFPAFQFDQPQTGFTLLGNKNFDDETLFTVQGFLLENKDSSGVLYNMIGSNGATHYSYNISEDFLTQLDALKPDLIIVSLGTNEAYVRRFNATKSAQTSDQFIDEIKKKTGCNAIIVTTPNDIMLGRRYKTYNASKMTNILYSNAKKHKTALWDLYAIMGGYGSIYTWYRRGYAQYDKIHLTRRGYELCANMFYSSFKYAYNDYKKRLKTD